MSLGYNLFTINAYGATPGAIVGVESIGSGIRLPAILIGDPLHSSMAGLHVVLDDDLYTLWEQAGEVLIGAAAIESTFFGPPKLVATRESMQDACLCVVRTELGMGGHTSLTGDWLDDLSNWGPRLGRPFPGTTLLSQSFVRRAPHPGTGEHHIVLVPRATVFRVSASTDPLECRFFCWDGGTLRTVHGRERARGAPFPLSTSP